LIILEGRLLALQRNWGVAVFLNEIVEGAEIEFSALLQSRFDKVFSRSGLAGVHSNLNKAESPL
jgi:hypothetical protein